MNRPFKFTTEVYYKALSNLIPYNVDNVKIVYYGGNIASGYTTGIDFKIFGEFVEGTDSFGPPHTGLERMVFRAPAYKRVDIGMSYRLLDNEDGRNQKKFIRYLRNVWLGVDCFNLFDISNVSSYYWVTDVTNQQYAVPNYLTGRQINARILIEL